MKQPVTIFFVLWAFIFMPQLESLNRDYHSNCEEGNTYQHYYAPYCLYHSPEN